MSFIREVKYAFKSTPLAFMTGARNFYTIPYMIKNHEKIEGYLDAIDASSNDVAIGFATGFWLNGVMPFLVAGVMWDPRPLITVGLPLASNTIDFYRTYIRRRTSQL